MPKLSAAAECDQRILDVVRAIPFGQIASYGGVAERAGLRRGARRVARALAGNLDPELPWHRVLRSGGRIAFPADSAGFFEQARRLRREGHALRGSRLVRMLEPNTLDAAIWRIE
jgi:methylated-DNA-protein-cysteine methyltransferase-like protein